MTYDAVLAARRGLGVEEQRLAPPALLEAIYHARYAEAYAPRLGELRDLLAMPDPDPLPAGWLKNRVAAREALAELEAALYPGDEDEVE